MFHIFHFLQCDMVFGNVIPLSWIFNAISNEKSCLISMPFQSTYIDVRTVIFFPPAESWLVNSNFQPYARLFTCMSFRLVSKQRKASNAVGMSCLIFWLQARELRLWVCFNTFRNFKRSLNKRRMSPAQTITSEWTEEKCLDKRQTTNKPPNTS